MSYSVKNGKLAKRHLKVGDIIHVSYGRNSLGYWRAETEQPIHGVMDLMQFRHGGPFRTQREAEKNAVDTILGPKFKLKEGGTWDPAWDRMQ